MQRRLQELRGELVLLRALAAKTGLASAELPHDLAVFQGNADRVLERELPDFAVVVIGDGERLAGVLDLGEAAGLDVGMLDSGGQAHVVREVAVFHEEKRLRGGAAGNRDGERDPNR